MVGPAGAGVVTASTGPVSPRAAGGRHSLGPRSALGRLWELLRLPVAGTVLGVAAGVAVSLAGGPSWQAESTVTFAPPSQDLLVFPGANPASADRELADAAALATSQTVLAPAASRLGTEDWTVLRDATTVTPTPGSSVITVAVTAADQADASARVNAVVTAFADAARQAVVDEATRTAEAAARGDTPAEGQGDLADIRARAEVLARTADPVRVLSTTPATQTAPAPVRDAATGGVLGLLLAATLLAVRRVRPSQVSTGHDAGEVLGLPAGVIRAGQVVPGSERLIEDLQRLEGRRPGHRVVVLPAGAASVAAAQEVAAVLRDTIPAHRAADEHVPADGAAADRTDPATSWVRATGNPSATIVAPLLEEATAVVLAVQGGAPVREVRAAQRLSRQWQRPPDAVIVMDA
jgi:capsular polysaccharide biosynthesis protein